MTSSTVETTNTPQLDDWALYSALRTRRVIAFLIDYALVGLLSIAAIPLIALFGIVTFGAGWMLYFIYVPMIALLYIAWTVGGPNQATWGMQLMDLQLVRYDGQRIDWMTGVVHAVLFWAAHTILTPAIALVALFTRHKRLLHDLALGTVVVRRSQISDLSQ
ncbi:MAG: RDD family protein [Pseudomonadota bacterium]